MEIEHHNSIKTANCLHWPGLFVDYCSIYFWIHLIRNCHIFALNISFFIVFLLFVFISFKNKSKSFTVWRGIVCLFESYRLSFSYDISMALRSPHLDTLITIILISIMEKKMPILIKNEILRSVLCIVDSHLVPTEANIGLFAKANIHRKCNGTDSNKKKTFCIRLKRHTQVGVFFVIIMGLQFNFHSMRTIS